MYNNSAYMPQQQRQLMQPQLYKPSNMDYTVMVNSRESAYQYCQQNLGPNCTSPAMFDTTNVGVMYIGTTDGAGVPTIEAFDISPHVDPQKAVIDTSKYVSKDEFGKAIAEIKEAINEIHGQVQPASAAARPLQPVAAG